MVSDTGVVITPISQWTGLPSEPYKSHWRPPDYNAEDYVGGLGSRGSQPPREQREMSLRQFSTLSDLLGKLSADLRAAYPSFVQEFVSAGLDGCGLLLETLRGVQTGQAGRQALLDELACLQCLAACFRSEETPRRLASAPAGLSPLAAAVMSSVNRSRILSLQILGKVCEGDGFGPVSDAMSAMRLRFGEPVRFKFLCGILSSASPELLLAGLTFLNSFLEAAAEPQARLYIQAELAQAGFDPDLVIKTLPSKVPCVESIRSELNRWHRLHVDVKKLKSREGELVKEVHQLKDKLKILERKLQALEEEKSQVSWSESRLKSRCSELEREVSSLRGGPSSPAEDEGISSSGQDTEREPLIFDMYSSNNPVDNKLKEEEETTIDEVIEELENIINDAESDIKERRDAQKGREETTMPKYYSKFMQRPSNNLESNETEIIPAKIIPYPPRRSRSLYFERGYSNDIFFDENETDNSDSLLSASNEHIQYFNNSPTKTHLELLQREVHKSYVRRRETFHHPFQKEESMTEIKPEIKNRRGSLDGVFRYNEMGANKGTKIYIDASENLEKRLMSKSLDRIRDGLDTMVDIVMTDDLEGPPVARPVPMLRTVTGRSREESGRQREVQGEQREDGGRREEGLKRPAVDRTVFLPIRDDPQSFLLRPSLNAGLYSGHNHQPSITTTINISDYYNKSLNGLNLSITGKLTDLPSGLY